MGHKLHWVAEQDNEVVGVYALYGRQQLPMMNLATTGHIVKMYGIKSAIPIKHALQAGSIISTPRKDVLHLANFGVSATKRSSGIGAAMLKHAARFAREQGYRGLSLDVSVKNPRGQALYEKTGFVFVRENAFKGNTDKVPNSRLMLWTI
jgi:ribosomal protein S18 acetylase RimI-like enzyme